MLVVAAPFVRDNAPEGIVIEATETKSLFKAIGRVWVLDMSMVASIN
jgi:hypothetical protein